MPDTAPELRSSSAPPRPRARLLAALVTAIAALLTFAFALRLTPWWTEGTKLRIFDFAYHIHLVAQFWFGDLANPYDHDAQRRVLTELIGREWRQAMPIGICPSALLLWFPFAAVARYDLTLAHAAWLSGSVALLTATLCVACRNGAGRLPVLAGALLLVSLASKTFLITVVLGQTSLVALSLLILLWRRQDFCIPKSELRVTVLDGVLLSLLSLKPTYLLVGTASLLLQRRVRAACIGLGFVMLETAVVLPKLGTAGFIDFLNALQIYSSGVVPSYYRDSIVLGTMVTFTSAVAESAPARTSLVFGIARIVSIVGVGASIVFAVRASRTAALPRSLFICILGTVLLFSPYLGSYEDLLFLAGVGVLVRDGVSFPRLNVGWMSYALMVWVYFNRDATLHGVPLWVQWLLKLGLVAGLYVLSRRDTGATRERALETFESPAVARVPV